MRLREDVVVRFWSQVDVTAECWIWTGDRDRYGYGRCWNGGKQVRAHRFAYELLIGTPPKLLDHRPTCTKACVNPSHLKSASCKQNQENRSGAQKNSASGVRGVHWDKRNQRWLAQVQHNYKNYFVGRFASLEDATRAAQSKRLELFTNSQMDEALSVKEF